MTTRYILYCAQEANFQTRSMLIPYDLIMQCDQRVKDLQVLRDLALHNISFDYKGKNYTIDRNSIYLLGNTVKELPKKVY